MIVSLLYNDTSYFLLSHVQWFLCSSSVPGNLSANDIPDVHQVSASDLRADQHTHGDGHVDTETKNDHQRQRTYRVSH